MKADKDIKLQVNNVKSIEQLCSTTWEALYSFVYFKVQNREEAEDITQETYFKAITYIQKNNVSIDKSISFLKTVALNVIRDRWRKNKRQGRVVNIDDVNPEETATEDHTENMAQREFIQAALKLLNEEQRTVIELRIIKGYSVKDTAIEMSKNESSIRVIQHRALKNLTKIIKNDY
jgi:RNA polymerase sigma-70 factor (ECF subfamily)